jgi:hypothetical protein
MHYLADYQSFATTDELNHAIYAHIKRHTYELNETDRATLKAIARYAVKFAGAAHLKAETIAHLIDKSVKTARRSVNKLAELGIVQKVATLRKVNGGKGANIIVILPADDTDDSVMSLRVQSTTSSRGGADKPTDSKAEVAEMESESPNSFKLLKNNVIDTTIPSNALKSTLPSVIYDAMARFFNAEDIYRYYGILLRAKASVDATIVIEDDPEPFVEAWNATMLKAKQGKVRRLCDYLYASFRQAAVTVKRRHNLNDSDRFYNWLDAV